MGKKLTLKESVQASYDLWLWLSKTGKQGLDWPGWSHNGGNHKFVKNLYFECGYTLSTSNRRCCSKCYLLPLWKQGSQKIKKVHLACELDTSPFRMWQNAFYNDDGSHIVGKYVRCTKCRVFSRMWPTPNPKKVLISKKSARLIADYCKNLLDNLGKS